jgi:membrane-bound serine protease (ClpP class)
MLATFEGPVTPILASYLERAIGDAEAAEAEALILELDTPGGSVDITRGIVQQMTGATVPIVVYVAPRGAQAGSAGTFITLAAHVAAMAPGTSIGAASPVGPEGQELPDTLREKEVNILVAGIKNLAASRGEEAVAWAEKAVSEAAAATAEEALALGVVDIVADDVDDLLAQLDGREVTVAGEARTLETAGKTAQTTPMSPIEGFLNAITNPAIAAILLTLGLNALLFELSSPGGYVAGVIGTVCLLLALYALGAMDANWIGLGFIGLAFLLFVLDIKAPTHGALTVGGIAAFVLGLYLLFNRSAVEVPWLSIILLAVGSAIFFAFAVSKAVAARLGPPKTGIESLVGRKAEVRQTLEPEGIVFIEGELWRARLDAGTAAVGEEVTVAGYEGNTLSVRRTWCELQWRGEMMQGGLCEIVPVGCQRR